MFEQEMEWNQGRSSLSHPDFAYTYGPEGPYYIPTTYSLAARLRDTYTVINPSQGKLLLSFIRTIRGRFLNSRALGGIVKYTLSQWEGYSPERYEYLFTSIRRLLFITRTNHQCSSNQSTPLLERYALPTPCPTATLLLATSYLDRLRTKYPSATQSEGCCLRLVIIAYIIAAKFIHSNLAAYLGINLHTSSEHPLSNEIDWHIKTAAYASQLLVGTSVRSLLKMEYDLLSFLDYNIQTSGTEQLLDVVECCLNIQRLVPDENVSGTILDWMTTGPEKTLVTDMDDVEVPDVEQR
ncbi:uncharacterized protein VTP21DRAFT_261 [Calcarisporiella thermophila]|uniref:uncharacterized protein n=1 Tax=Calcarisporiella thermophila TaxID=911321 RepID=UPI00374484D7